MSTDSLGNESTTVVAFEFVQGPAAELPYSIDFSDVSGIQSVGQVVDGNWGIVDGALRTLQMGYDRLFTVGDIGWTDYVATVELTLHYVEPGDLLPEASNNPALGLIARWPGHVADGEQPARQWWPMGAYAHQRWKDDLPNSVRMDGDAGLILGASSNRQFELETKHTLRLQVETSATGETRYSFKLWKSTEAEPTQWQIVGTEAAGTDVPSGSLLLVAHHVDVSYHSVVVEPVQ